jgi:hypothetical protein
MKDYAEMSDFEINKMVAMTIEGVDFDNAGNAKYAVDCFIKSMDGESVNVLWSGNEEYSFFNPCNNPSDMWPLIVENKMDVCYIDSHNIWKVFAIKDSEIISYEDKNPLRAAAIVFLMMNEKD